MLQTFKITGSRITLGPFTIFQENYAQKIVKIMQVPINIPDGQSGEWEVETKVINEEAAKRSWLHGLMNGSGRYSPAGTYRGLLYKGEVIMSNTPNEIGDHYPLFRNASGRVLINGLGLGMCIEMIIDKVDHITAVEISEDIIKLVGLYYKDNPKVEIVHTDAFEYKPEKGIRFNAVWHDVWPEICTDNLPEMARLHRKYGRLTDWQGSWMKPYLEREKRKERREEKFYREMFGHGSHLSNINNDGLPLGTVFID